MSRKGCLLAAIAEILHSEGMKIQNGDQLVEANPLNVLRKIYPESNAFLAKSFEVVIREACSLLGLDICTIYSPTRADIAEALNNGYHVLYAGPSNKSMFNSTIYENCVKIKNFIGSHFMLINSIDEKQVSFVNPANKDQNSLPVEKFDNVLKYHKVSRIVVIAKKGEMSEEYKMKDKGSKNEKKNKEENKGGDEDEESGDEKDKGVDEEKNI